MDGKVGNNKGTTGGMYKPSGELQGDTSGMPNKGTGTGLNGDTYGADIGPSSTNRQGGMGGAAKSDEMDCC
jgi:hypothetical protein